MSSIVHLLPCKVKEDLASVYVEYRDTIKALVDAESVKGLDILVLPYLDKRSCRNVIEEDGFLVNILLKISKEIIV